MAKVPLLASERISFFFRVDSLCSRSKERGKKIKEVPQESVPLTRLRNLCCVGLCSRYLDFLISALVVVAYSLTAIVIDYDAVGCGCIRGMFPSKARQRDARNHCRGV